MDPFIPESVSPFAPGDLVSIGQEADAPSGTVLHEEVQGVEAVWIVLLDEDREESFREDELFLLRKAQ